jgi:hypothetical protein
MLRVSYFNEALRVSSMNPDTAVAYRQAIAKFPIYSSTSIGPQPILQSTQFSLAEAQVGNNQCVQILLLPADSVTYEYQLKSSELRFFKHLPEETNRIRKVTMKGPMSVVIEAAGSLDGTQTLVCVF